MFQQAEESNSARMYLVCPSGEADTADTKAWAVFIPDQLPVLHIVLHPEMDDHGRPKLVDALRQRHTKRGVFSDLHRLQRQLHYHHLQGTFPNTDRLIYL